MNFKGLFQISWVCPLYVSINVKPERGGGGGGPRGICEEFDLYCFPHPQEFD